MTATPEKVEQVARVLAIADGKDPDKPAWVRGAGVTFGLCWRDQYVDKAIAAIEATLREPTDAMVWASCNYFKKLAACLHTGKEPKPCQRCPASVETDYGPGQQACRGFAEEYIEHVFNAALEPKDATTVQGDEA